MAGKREEIKRAGKQKHEKRIESVKKKRPRIRIVAETVIPFLISIGAHITVEMIPLHVQHRHLN